MNNVFFECPVCKKKFETIGELGKCALKHEQEDKKKRDELSLVRADIAKAYETLKAAVAKYNKIDDKGYYTCTLKHEPRKFLNSDYISTDIPKEENSKNDKLAKDFKKAKDSDYKCYLNGKNITKDFNSIIDNISNSDSIDNIIDFIKSIQNFI